MSLWEARDERVLAHLLAHPPEYGSVWVQMFDEQPHKDLAPLSGAHVYLAIETLHDAGFVSWKRTEAAGGGERHYQDFMVTGAGKQALGLWPRFDALGSPAELAAVLDALAQEAANDEERSNLSRAAAAIRRSAPDLVKAGFVGALSALARSSLGI